MNARATSLLLALLLLPFAAAPAGAAADEGKSEVPPGFLYVPGGKFLMGADYEKPAKEGEKPEVEWRSDSPMHEAVVEPFLIARFEVTNGRFADFIAAKGYEKKEYWTEKGWAWLKSPERQERKAPTDWAVRQKALADEFDKHPVSGVTFFEAEAYAKYAGARLPTEKEWERAARGTDGRLYPWGDEFEHGVRERKPENERGVTHPVGANPADVSPTGAFDMGGNVAEWTSTTFCPYPGTKYRSRHWGENARFLKVARGGSWRWIDLKTPNEFKCRTTYRDIQNPPENGASYIGFRLAMDPPAPGK